MKVTSFRETVAALNSVREKQDADGGNARQQHEQQQKRKEAPEEEIEVTEEKVGAAIDAFAKDAGTQANHLNATMSGQGPGLRVVLKDGSGAVVRQLTGEEFLKLREAASMDTKPRGRLLDRKL